MAISAKRVAILLLPIVLAGCFGSGDDELHFTLFKDNTPQQFPDNYRTETLAFMRTYLNNPVGVREAAMAEPVERDVNGHRRYVACLRYSARASDGDYRGSREHAVVFVKGRLDHMIEKGSDLCAGVAYAPFPEMEKMTR